MRRLGVIILSLSLLLLAVAGKSTKRLVAVDRMFVVGEDLVVANRAAKQLLRLNPDGGQVLGCIELATAATDLAQLPNGDMWVACEGNTGWMYLVDGERFAVKRRVASGATPSAVEYNVRSGSLWVAQRYRGELWEVDAVTGECRATVKVGREPVDMLSFDDDSYLLVVNNMPECAATEECVAAQIDVVDVAQRKVASRISLPNGSTDVKAVTKDRQGDYAYVTHLVSRYQLPTSQLDRGWMVTNALSIIDLRAKAWLTTVLLDTPQRGAANPWGVCVTPDNKLLVVAAAGTDEVIVIDREALHLRLSRAQAGEKVTPSMGGWDNIPNDAGFLHGIREFVPTRGKGVRSVVATDSTIYAANYYTAQITTFSRRDYAPVVTDLGMPLSSTAVGRGDMYFHDATLCYQMWQSCATCHPNDGRMDGLNWDLLNDGMGNPKNTKSLLYAHRTAPCMATGIRANAETAVRSGIRYILFAGDVDEQVATAMDEYLKVQEPLPSPYLERGRLSAAARRGRQIFGRECAACHTGEHYSNFQLYDVEWSVGADKGRKMDVTHLNECWRTAPYLYDGRSYTMLDMLKVHGTGGKLTESELSDLAEYVLSL